MALHALTQVETIPAERSPRSLPLDAETQRRLVPLRQLMRKARSASRVDGYRICAAVGCGIAQQRETLSTTLVQVLGDAWGQAPVVYEPSAKTASFDEVWLLSVVDAQNAGNADSVAFLLTSRIPRHSHRMVLSLIAQLAL
ncbi:MAG: hypothetical protein AAGK28_09510 [Pseudomonadota bacterium]